jgi:thiosulfate/3-mercaptopyruvate sulfurtransferase
MNEFNHLISPETLVSQTADPNWCVVDCSFDLMNPSAGREGYLAGHIPAAVYADLNQDLAGPVLPESGRHPLPDVAALCSTFGRLGIGNNTQVVVYDTGSGAMAARAWWLLRLLGHVQVRVLEGGFSRWQREGFSVDAGQVERNAETFIGSVTRSMVLETGELVDSGSSVGELRLLDARDAARFFGEQEPIDAVAGHIPGALNLPFTNCLNADGTWKTSAELRDLFADVLGEELDGPWSAMCGSGVTACHLALSGLLAGLQEPRLYVGSWSEWIRDPERPIAADSE